MVAPFFEDFDIRPFALDERILRLRWLHTSTDRSFDVSEFSDGTLRFIALATLLRQPAGLRPSTIILDEPELGLHPFAINVLASLIQSTSVQTQMIVSTQSAQLIDSFEPEDVLVADRVDGATQLTRLKSSELAEWLEDYSLGELWQKNQLGGRPAPERRKTPGVNRLLVHVEGQTEGGFRQLRLGESAQPRRLRLGRRPHSGQRPTADEDVAVPRGWISVRREIVRHLRRDGECVVANACGLLRNAAASPTRLARSRPGGYQAVLRASPRPWNTRSLRTLPPRWDQGLTADASCRES